MRVRIQSLIVLCVSVGCVTAATTSVARGQVVNAARPEIPEAKAVSAINIKGSVNRSGLPTVKLTEKADVEKVVRWLRAVNWAAEPLDLTRVRIIRVGDLSVVEGEKTTLRFVLTTGGIVYGNGLWRADVDALQKLLPVRENAPQAGFQP